LSGNKKSIHRLLMLLSFSNPTTNLRARYNLSLFSHQEHPKKTCGGICWSKRIAN